MSDDVTASRNFIEQIIDGDLASGKHTHIVTRFPPEPNGFLHIGHAKSICLNYGLSQQFDGTFHLRFDDTNPVKEDDTYVQAIKADVRWLGAEWHDKLFNASDYYDRLYDCAEELVRRGKAYVCELTATEMNEHRGSPMDVGKPSPWRDRSIEENMDLLGRMKAGEFEDGSRTLRAKIDMNSPNVHMRDPVVYRIRRAHHHRTGDTWCIYPMYDFAHCLSDSFEGITHSCCTLEFEVHRPLYDWFLEALETPCRPRQIEFARLNLTYTVMSKRKLLELVTENHVNGWDDPRMPTIAGMRRRGYPASAIRNFCEQIGVTKFNSLTQMSLLEHCLREELNPTADRKLGVLDPVKVVIENFPEGETEWFDAVNNPTDADSGTRKVALTREIWIERDDFMEDPPRKFFRLGPGREVRLKYACYVTCTGFEVDADGKVTEIRCTWDPESRGATTPDKRKIKGTIHWVSATHAIPAEVRLYDRLFTEESPDGNKEADYRAFINPDSLATVNAWVEPSVADTEIGTCFQFERTGYFCTDPDSTADKVVINRTVGLRDSWTKKAGK